MKSSLRNMVMVLLLITLIASGAVGVVYQLTIDPIEVAKAAKIKDAITQVLPPFDKLEPKKEVLVDGQAVTIYTAVGSTGVIGYAVESFSKNGFGGLIKILVGFLPDGTINGTAVISHAETPGLGDKMDKKKSDFAVQFEGKNPDNFKLGVRKDGAGDVDAITASTISSRAFTEAIQIAYDTLNKNK